MDKADAQSRHVRVRMPDGAVAEMDIPRAENQPTTSPGFVLPGVVATHTGCVSPATTEALKEIARQGEILTSPPSAICPSPGSWDHARIIDVGATLILSGTSEQPDTIMATLAPHRGVLVETTVTHCGPIVPVHRAGDCLDVRLGSDGRTMLLRLSRDAWETLAAACREAQQRAQEKSRT